MIPVLVAKGKTIAEVWDAALLALWENGMTIRTQYDYEPNTDTWTDPSIDCAMTMIVEQSVAEPRLHICLEGGPEQLGDYETEVVQGLKDDWVKKDPEDTKWTYTYSGRLHAYGGRMNFAVPKNLNEDVSLDTDEWVGLSYLIPVVYGDGRTSKAGLTIEPFDQIEYIVQAIAKTPYTRRAVATTRFPVADSLTDDPPCLGEVWCRGYYEDGCLNIDMHTKWRSRDAWGAALFNMYALTEMHRDICNRVQAQFDKEDQEWTIARNCPICNEPLTVSPEDNRGYAELGHAPKTSAADIICESCQVRPYKVRVGAYVDQADSFHVYGRDMKDFEERFIRGVHGIDPVTKEKVSEPMPNERRYKDLTTQPWAEMLEAGRKAAFERHEKETEA